MDDLDGKIGALLSDPESMQQLKELAEMLGSEMNGGSQNQPSGNSSPSDGNNTENAANSNSGADSIFGGMNFDTLIQIGSAISAAGGTDKNRSLLLALKPHVSSQRQEKIDRAVRMLKIYAVITALRESGLLNGGFEKFL
ncbi:MAG: hypothetical protein ACI4KF_03985 [Huintestinicola sp.]